MPHQNVLLLSCRRPFLDDSKVYLPLASLYWKSYIDTHPPNIIVPLGDESYDLSDLSLLEPFDAVGLSIMTSQRHEAVQLATAIKRRWPHKTIIAGGPHDADVGGLPQEWTRCTDSFEILRHRLSPGSAPTMSS